MIAGFRVRLLKAEYQCVRGSLRDTGRNVGYFYVRSNSVMNVKMGCSLIVGSTEGFGSVRRSNQRIKENRIHNYQRPLMNLFYE